MEMEKNWFKAYKTVAYIDLGIKYKNNTAEYGRYTQDYAKYLKWKNITPTHLSFRFPWS